MGENVACRADVGGGDAVGDFQLQGCGIDLGFAKNGANSVGQMRAGEVAGGDVGGDAEGREGGLCQEDEKSSCCTKDEGEPFEAAL